jgi:uncharacterized protein YyaL (SSP411 family)
VIVAWNGLMIDALSQAASAFDEPRYLQAATRAAEFITTHLVQDNGRLLHTWRHGKAKLDAYLDDYASLLNSLVSLYEASFDERWIEHATHLADALLDRFADLEGGGFFYTANDHETLIARQKDFMDNATPSGNALAATGLLRLAKLAGKETYLRAAEGTIRAALGVIEQSPTAAGQMLIALDMLLGPTPEIVIWGQQESAETKAILTALRSRYLPNKLVALRSAASIASMQAEPLNAIFKDKQTATEQTTVYICENFTCQAPVVGADAIRAIQYLE